MAGCWHPGARQTIVNSGGKEVFVRNVAEHVLEDLGWIPSLSDWLREMPA